MKKLIMVAAVVCVAIAASAATINWSSGAVQTPTSATDGTLSGNRLTSASGFTLKMYAFESLSDISFTAGDLYKWYDNDPTAAFKGLTAIEGTVTMGASSTTAVARGLISEDTGTSVYGAILFVLEDATSGDPKWYIENSGSKATGKATQTLANLAVKIGGTGAATAWVAAPSVPEPTSAMLMLLGVAGLALKRKRA